MNVALFAYSSLGVRVLRTLQELGQSVVAVWTHADDPGERVWFDSVRARATAAGIPVHDAPQRGTVDVEPCRARLAAARADVLLAASFRSILPLPLLEVAPLGAYNLHGSLLPRYRGRSPLNWVLINGETETGMTLHRMAPRVDAGDIVGQLRLDVGSDETAPELGKRLEDAACALLGSSWRGIESGTAGGVPQDEAEATYCRGRTPEDGRFEWTWPRVRIHNLVRAVTRPFPGAFVRTPKGPRYVWKARLATSAAVPRLESGESWRPPHAKRPRHFFVGAGDGTLEVLDGDPLG